MVLEWIAEVAFDRDGSSEFMPSTYSDCLVLLEL
jgi:hypothetical protein